jgi:hypothetical protein
MVSARGGKSVIYNTMWERNNKPANTRCDNLVVMAALFFVMAYAYMYLVVINGAFTKIRGNGPGRPVKSVSHSVNQSVSHSPVQTAARFNLAAAVKIVEGWA